jgi:hypothetical protein
MLYRAAVSASDALTIGGSELPTGIELCAGRLFRSTMQRLAAWWTGFR